MAHVRSRNNILRYKVWYCKAWLLYFWYKTWSWSLTVCYFSIFTISTSLTDYHVDSSWPKHLTLKTHNWCWKANCWNAYLMISSMVAYSLIFINSSNVIASFMMRPFHFLLWTRISNRNIHVIKFLQFLEIRASRDKRTCVNLRNQKWSKIHISSILIPVCINYTDQELTKVTYYYLSYTFSLHFKL